MGSQRPRIFLADLGWGVSLVNQGWKMSHPLRAFSEDEIQREMLR